MKKLVMIFALGIFGIASIQAAGTALMNDTELIQLIQDRVRIEPEDLPDAVKTTIMESEETQSVVISEVYHVTDAEGSVHYEVIFGLEGEAFTKKYDPEGREITDAK